MELLYYRLLAIFQKARAPYILAGGKKGLMALVTSFYDVMDSHEQAKQVRLIHTADLAQSRQKLFMFLSGWFGGPNLYWQSFGHPRMRARHMKFPIGEVERDQWLWCMQQAINQRPWKPEFKEYAMKSFTDFAHHMQNRK